MSELLYYEAGYGKRIGATLIDSAIIFIPQFLYGIFFSVNQNVFFNRFCITFALQQAVFHLDEQIFWSNLGKENFQNQDY